MAVCPICDGKGFVYNALGNFGEDCGYCHGTGECESFEDEEQITNEKYLKQCTTEELAEWLANHTDYCAYIDCDNCPLIVEDGSCKSYLTDKEMWVEWLRGKHSGKRT